MKRRTGRKAVAVTPALPEESAMKKARHLPMFGPGIEITIPLHLWPAYAKIYQLKPAGFRYPVLLVKRVVEEEKNHDQKSQ